MRKFILGTDWWSDCDDVVAMRLLTRAVNRGEIQLLGVAINACMKNSVASLKGFLLADGLSCVPIGIDRNALNFGGTPLYQDRLAQNLCPNVTNSDAEDAVRLYRRLLASSKEKIEILEIGFLQVVSALLKSQSDDISEKTGIELVKEKVSKFWVMAGKWDADGEKEHNFCLNSQTRIAGKEFCNLCPVPVTFLGFEVGYGVITGNHLAKDDVLYQVLVDHGSADGRHSWDPMLVLMALEGDEEAAGYETSVGVASVDSETGANYFVKDPEGKHKYVIKKYENSFYENRINSLI